MIFGASSAKSATPRKGKPKDALFWTVFFAEPLGFSRKRWLDAGADRKWLMSLD
jgi:hypothetical protein